MKVNSTSYRLNYNVIGRLLFAIPIAYFGVRHLANSGNISALVPEFFSWGAHFFVILSGLALLLASVSIIVQRPTRYLAILLGLIILVFAVGVHLTSYLNGDPMSLDQVLKDVSLAGAAFYIGSTLQVKSTEKLIT